MLAPPGALPGPRPAQARPDRAVKALEAGSIRPMPHR